ncbi:hypothetical protein EV424DRAFT_1542320 [Suillus variegatus]|nr:hypothetical protein EV424DRAFT_1542320 [Suillus variegatus]
MPPVRPQVRRSERLKMLLQRLSAPLSIHMQPARGARGRGATTRGTRGRRVAATSASAAGDTPTGGISKIRTHPADRRILFYEGKKSHTSYDGPPSGSDKGKIHAIIAKHIFENNEIYQSMYAEDQMKFTQAVGNCLTYLKGKYKTHRARFKQTGAGVNPEEPGAAVNLLAQVLSDFPWYEDLDEIWRDNPAYAAKTFSSAPGAKEKEKPPPPPDPDDPMIIGDDAPVEDEHIDSAEGHPPTNPLEDHFPANPPPANPPPTHDPPAHDPPANPPPDFAMGEELGYDEQDVTMQEDQGEVEREEALTIQRFLSNKRPLSSPSPPCTHTCNRPSLRTFKSHADRAIGRGPMRSLNPSSSIALSSMKTTTRSTSSSVALSSMKTTTRSTSSGLLSPSSSSCLQTTLNDSGAKKSHLGKNIGSEVGSVCGKVETLTNNMSYIYTAKAAASEYKIAKVNALCHVTSTSNVRKRSEAIIVHQRCQESKTLDLQVLEAQAKVHAERKAALQLEIELLKLKGGVAD